MPDKREEPDGEVGEWIREEETKLALNFIIFVLHLLCDHLTADNMWSSVLLCFMSLGVLGIAGPDALFVLRLILAREVEAAVRPNGT